MLRFLLPLSQTWVTILSISKLSIVPPQPFLTPLYFPSIRAYVSKWWSMGFSRHDVNHFYNVFRHVIGRWLSLENSPDFGMTDVFPPENQRCYSWAPWVMTWNVLTTPSCSDRACFHQKFVILSSPGALQFLFFSITFTAFSLSNM